LGPLAKGFKTASRKETGVHNEKGGRGGVKRVS
jgi:hypothetical protein